MRLGARLSAGIVYGGVLVQARGVYAQARFFDLATKTSAGYAVFCYLVHVPLLYVISILGKSEACYEIIHREGV